MEFLLDDLKVLFPFPYMYKEQYEYMVALKQALDSGRGGHCLLEMPTGTGKTVALLSLIIAYQAAHEDVGKLIYCTRTVPEMGQVMEELSEVVKFRAKHAAKAAAAGPTTSTADPAVLGVCLSSRRNMCIHPRISSAVDRENVDAECRKLTASWVRSQRDGAGGEASAAAAAAAAPAPSGPSCDFFESYERDGADATLRGVYSIDDIKAEGKRRGWCPYFLTRHLISFANVVVYNYQYMLDPKVANMVSFKTTVTFISCESGLTIFLQLAPPLYHLFFVSFPR